MELIVVGAAVALTALRTAPDAGTSANTGVPARSVRRIKKYLCSPFRGLLKVKFRCAAGRGYG